MKIISYNVNGIRAAISKGLLEWIDGVSPDVVCFQELKATPDQIPLMEIESAGYRHYWFPAQKKATAASGFSQKKNPTMWFTA